MAPHFAGLSCSCCAVSPDSRQLATGWDYPDNAVRVWDLHTGELLAVMPGHRNRVSSVAFSPDGKRIASASQDQTVRIWDAASGKPVAVLQGHTSHVVAGHFQPGWHACAFPAHTTARCGCGTRPAANRLPCSRATADGVWACAYSPDGAWLASASVTTRCGCGTRRGGAERRAARPRKLYLRRRVQPGWCPVASAAWDNTVRLWNAITGRQTALFTGTGRTTAGKGFGPDRIRSTREPPCSRWHLAPTAPSW